MPWAIFSDPFDFDYRPVRAVSQHVEPSDAPQEFPTPLIDAAVKKGAATRTKKPTAIQKRALKAKPSKTTEKDHGQS